METYISNVIKYTMFKKKYFATFAKDLHHWCSWIVVVLVLQDYWTKLYLEIKLFMIVKYDWSFEILCHLLLLTGYFIVLCNMVFYAL
jgi:hypothetical protein